MQLRLPWNVPVTPRGRRREYHVAVGNTAVAVDIVRHRRARRYILRITRNGRIRLTVPRGASIGGGLQFAARQADWIERERRRQSERERPWTDGTTVLFRGERVALRVTDEGAQCGDRTVAIAHGDVRGALEAHWRALAGTELPARCRELAAEFAFTVERIAVRNQRSRWGACSSRGMITLNWRLIQMPPAVSDYVILHELSHLRHPNHSIRFWRAVERVCPGWREAEHWLRRHGRELL